MQFSPDGSLGYMFSRNACGIGRMASPRPLPVVQSDRAEITTASGVRVDIGRGAGGLTGGVLMDSMLQLTILPSSEPLGRRVDGRGAT